MIQKCKLCGLDKKLIQAPVIPKSFYRIDPAERLPAKLVTNTPGQYAQKIRKGIYDSSIVCEDCERRFSKWDDYGHALFVESWAQFETVKIHGGPIGYRLEKYNYPELKLFFMSVLWRAAVSNHRMFEKVELGPKEKILRKSILDNDPGERDFFGVVLQAFDTTEIGMLDPHPERFFGARFYRFYLSQIIAYIKVVPSLLLNRSPQSPFHATSP